MLPPAGKTSVETVTPKQINDLKDEKNFRSDPNAFYTEDDELGTLPYMPKPQALIQTADDDDDLVRGKWIHDKSGEPVYVPTLIPSGEGKAVEFVFDDLERKFTAKMGAGIYHIKLSKQLAYVFGYEQSIIRHAQKAKFTPDLSGGVRQMYVYAPKLVEDTMIGNRLAPLLRVVNVTGSPGSDVNEVIYTNEFFHLLQNKRISEINIEIQTPFGRYLKFNWGTCVLTLHFRRRFI